MYHKCLNVVAKNWLSCFMVLILFITSINSWNLGAGVLWNVANALGYAAFICLLYTCFSKPVKLNVSSHRTLGYITLLFTTLHVLILLFNDPIVIEYLMPDAPLYMWLGLYSTFLIVCIITSSLTRFKSVFYSNAVSFKKAHKITSWLIIFGCLFHIIESGFYLYQRWQIIAIILVAILALFPVPMKRLTPIKSYQVTLQLLVFMVIFIICWGWA